MHGKYLCICFVDYGKAFDRVDWRKMMWMLKDIGVDWRDRNLIAFRTKSSCIIGQGVRQGCPLSPLLLNIYIQYVINEAPEDVEEGIKVGGVRIPAVRFADEKLWYHIPYQDCKLLWMHCRIHLRSMT